MSNPTGDALKALIQSDGGSTSYYELPEGASELNDLIEHKNMSFALGNIFKACYRLGEKDSADTLYDLNKIVFFANRLMEQEKKKKHSSEHAFPTDLFENLKGEAQYNEFKKQINSQTPLGKTTREY